MELREGIVISGQFRVGRTIAQDDSGTLLAARQATPDRPVTIKVLPAGTPQDRLVAHFAKAARIASEHVATLLDVGSLADGRPFVVMEYLEGRNLVDLLASGPLPIEMAVDCVIQVCEAVAAAHAAGIVHRRLRTSILFVFSQNDQRIGVKVLDFGTRPATDIRNIPDGTDNDAPDVPEYMAPEQLVAPKHSGRECDQWATGVILYQLLTSQLPFEGKTREQLIKRIVEKNHPPMRSLRKEIPEELDKVIRRCLAKARYSRYSSMREFAEALAPFASATMRELASRIVLIEHPIKAERPDEGKPPTVPPPKRSSSPPRAPAAPYLTSSEGIAFRKVLRDGRIEALDADAAARATRAKRVAAEAANLAREAAARPEGETATEEDEDAARPIIPLSVLMAPDESKQRLSSTRTLLLLAAIIGGSVLLGLLVGAAVFVAQRH
jgi:eukaryotic-like serine/threonine-protein kinase